MREPEINTSKDSTAAPSPVPPCVVSCAEELADRRILGLVVSALGVAAFLLLLAVWALASQPPLPIFVGSGG